MVSFQFKPFHDSMKELRAKLNSWQQGDKPWPEVFWHKHFKELTSHFAPASSCVAEASQDPVPCSNTRKIPCRVSEKRICPSLLFSLCEPLPSSGLLHSLWPAVQADLEVQVCRMWPFPALWGSPRCDTRVFNKPDGRAWLPRLQEGERQWEVYGCSPVNSYKNPSNVKLSSKTWSCWSISGKSYWIKWVSSDKPLICDRARLASNHRAKEKKHYLDEDHHRSLAASSFQEKSKPWWTWKDHFGAGRLQVSMLGTSHWMLWPQLVLSWNLISCLWSTAEMSASLEIPSHS